MGELSELARFVWASKYRHLDETVEGTWRRVAQAVASAEPAPAAWVGRFERLLSSMRFLPGGRVLAGAGTGLRLTLLNCFVGRPPDDTLAGILDSLKETALTLRQGGGVGCDFSRLRPAGERSLTCGNVASGPVSFMRIWDSMSTTLSSTGSRRGAMMGTLRCDHPDIGAFIDAKRDFGALTNFNLSVLISDAFMRALEEGQPWVLRFPEDEGDSASFVRSVDARVLWRRLCSAAQQTAEPGVLFIDRINRENNLSYRERISATNPCGEAPLPSFGACDLGSLNLVRFIDSPFEDRAHFDERRFRESVRLAVRFLDDVISVSGFPLPAQQKQALGARRLGLGFTGLGDALFMMRLHYDSEAARDFAARLIRTLRDEAYAASVELADEKGAFPYFEHDAYLSAPFVRRLGEGLRTDIARRGIRNSHLISIAPAGSISLLAGNVSSGIEPVFVLEGARLVRSREGAARQMGTRDYAYDAWLRHAGATRPGPDWMVTARELGAGAHLAMQAAIQPCVDNAIAKTVNLPAEATVETVSGLYRAAYESGLKGCTVYRSGSREGEVLQACREARCCA